MKPPKQTLKSTHNPTSTPQPAHRKKLKALVLFSGGLDSRVTLKLLQEQKNIETEAVFFKLPFGGGCCNDVACVINFAQVQQTKLHIIDFTKGKLFQQYLEVIKNPKHGTGTAINPCKDCKIFMLKQAKKLSDKIGAELVATGEVIGQRPMSQMKKSLLLSEKESKLQGRLIRPLSAKLLPKTNAEKKGLIDTSKLMGLEGRRRTKQIAYAKKHRLKYPNSGGGCLLCEKDCAKKMTDLFKHKKKIIPEEVQLLNIGRHFRKAGKIVLGRNNQENQLIEILNKKIKYKIDIQKTPGPTIIYQDKKDKEFIKKLFKAYSKGGTQKDKDKLEKYKI